MLNKINSLSDLHNYACCQNCAFYDSRSEKGVCNFTNKPIPKYPHDICGQYAINRLLLTNLIDFWNTDDR
jgi:hypothetical protein